jgi:O-antigen ligase
MICLIQIACWWFWFRARPTFARRVSAIGAIAGALIVLFATGSRSGLLGFIMLTVLLQTGPPHARLRAHHVGTLVIGGLLAAVLLAPPEAWQRMLRFSTADPHASGARSVMKREETVNLGTRIFLDYPLTGVGLGNFQEVARQVYRDQFFRPPHNSYVWAAAEGGVFLLSAYLFLFALTWLEIRAIMRLAERDWEIAHMAAAVRIAFVLCLFFSLFADLWMNPITYVILGLVVSMHRVLREGTSLGRETAAVPARVSFAAAR